MARALEFFVREGPHGIVNVCSGVKRSIKMLFMQFLIFQESLKKIFIGIILNPMVRIKGITNKKLRDIGFNIQVLLKKRSDYL